MPCAIKSDMCGHAAVPIMSGRGQTSGFITLNEKTVHYIACNSRRGKGAKFMVTDCPSKLKTKIVPNHATLKLCNS